MLNGVVSERDDLRIAGGILRVSDTGSRYENLPFAFPPVRFGSLVVRILWDFPLVLIRGSAQPADEVIHAYEVKNVAVWGWQYWWYVAGEVRLCHHWIFALRVAEGPACLLAHLLKLLY